MGRKLPEHRMREYEEKGWVSKRAQIKRTYEKIAKDTGDLKALFTKDGVSLPRGRKLLEETAMAFYEMYERFPDKSEIDSGLFWSASCIMRATAVDGNPGLTYGEYFASLIRKHNLPSDQQEMGLLAEKSLDEVLAFIKISSSEQREKIYAALHEAGSDKAGARPGTPRAEIRPISTPQAQAR